MYFLTSPRRSARAKVVEEILKSSPDKKELRKRIEQFKLGECLVYSPQWLGEPQEFKFLNKESKHYGETPTLKKLEDYEVKKKEEEEIEEKKPAVTSKQLIIGILLGITMYVVSTVI